MEGLLSMGLPCLVFFTALRLGTFKTDLFFRGTLLPDVYLILSTNLVKYFVLKDSLKIEITEILGEGFI